MNVERRRATRLAIVESFSFFLELPDQGDGLRLQVEDISKLGIGFLVENDLGLNVKVGDTLNCLFHLNQTLSIPLTVKIARLDAREGQRKVGAEIQPSKAPAYRAYETLLKLLDDLAETDAIKN